MNGVAHPTPEDDRLAERKRIVYLRCKVGVFREQATEFCRYLAFNGFIDQGLLSC